MSGPLEGIRVIDLTEGWAGPFCTMELGDLGADVVKVEPLDGDLTRRLGSTSFKGESLPFLAVNRSKRSIAIDRTHTEGADVVRRLAATAAVVVESSPPGELDTLGLGFEALRVANPSLVYATITGFGQSGPYRDWASSELVAQAMGAMTPRDPAFVGPDGEPIAYGGEQLSLFGGKYLFHGVTAALVHALRTGEGQRVDVSMLEVALARAMSLWPAPGSPPAPPARLNIWAGAVRAFETKDLPVEFNFRVSGYTPDDEGWQAFFGDVGATELIGDPRFATEALRTANFDALKAGLERHLVRFTAYEVMELVMRRGGMVAPWHTLDRALSHPQAVALDMTATVEHPTLGSLQMTNIPYAFLGSPAEIRLAPPTLGQHTLDVLTELGCSPEEITGLLSGGIIT